MTYKKQTAVSARAGYSFKKKAALGMTVALLGLSQQALAHVEYYDLNQGSQIGDLTAAGKTASTTQYGDTSAAVVALGNSAARGLGVISSQSDRPLNNTALWNATNQSYTGVGTFANSNTSFVATGNILPAANGNPERPEYIASVTSNTFFNSNTVDVNDVTDFGWGAGTTAKLGDSHKVDFFNFRLTEESTVDISWNIDADDGAGGLLNLDSAFTLYSGTLNYQGHDDGNEKLNPNVLGLPPVGGKKQDALDSLTAPADAQGITSSYRNTTASGPVPYVGQYNSLANWGQANVSGQWGNIAVLKAVNANTGAASTDGYSVNASDAIETLRIVLGAGNYTIGASGALGAIANAGAGTLGSIDSLGLTNLHGRLTFSAASVAAVPVPAAVWMFLTGMLGVLGLNRRKNRSMSM